MKNNEQNGLREKLAMKHELIHPHNRFAEVLETKREVSGRDF
jgi:hypothetical protein